MEFYLEKLRKDFLARRSKNPRYSIRAYASFLEINPSTLSKVLKAKRKLPLAKKDLVVKKLSLSESDRNRFYESLAEQRIATLESKESYWNYELLESSPSSKLISHWQYFAILNLVKLPGENESIDQMAKRLNLEPSDTAEYITHLLEWGFLEETPCGKLFRTEKNLSTPEEQASEALKEAHRQELALAKNSLESDPIDQRGFYSLTAVGDESSLQKIKKMSFDYLERCSKVLENSEQKEVYQMNIQIFPLTKKED